ncbi:hypothetical protein BSKO_10760 [Bryopsis sp. KO-2023]|nr:hypothetical protein BSKO_10760 [Bryopsis sp. KO-2023]
MDGSALHEKIKKAIQIVNDRQHIAAPVDCDKERTTHSDPQPENKAQGPAEEKVSDDCSRSEISKHEACQPPSDEHSSQIKNGGPPLLALEEDPCVCKPSQATTDEPLEERAEDAREPLKSLNNLTDIKVEDQKLVVCEEGHSFDISQDVKLKIDVAGGAKKGKGGGGGGGGTHPSLLPSVESGGSTCNPPPSRSQGLASASHAALVLGRELASRQAALARMHCARSTVSRFGWNPWRQVLEMGRRRTCLAEGHRRLKLLKATVVNWRLVLLPGRWEEVIREVGNVGRARVHHQVRRFFQDVDPDYQSECSDISFTIAMLRQVSERIVLELQREARVRLAMDSRKKSVCLKSWHLLSSAARLERAREENKNTAWNQVRGWIDDFRQERQKTSPISMEISFHLEDSDEDEKTDALEFF